MKKDKETLVIDIFGHEDAPFTQYPRPDLSPEEAVFYMAYVIDAEVRNGGLFGYFGNLSAGNYLAGDPIAALEVIGASRTANLLREAVQILFGSLTIPEDASQVEATIDAVTDSQLDALSTLDDRFYEEELPPLLYDYAEAHQTEIRGASATLQANPPSLTDRLKGLFGRK